VKFFLKNFYLYDHDTSTSQTDRHKTYSGNTAVCIASHGKNETKSDIQLQKYNFNKEIQVCEFYFIYKRESLLSCFTS